MIFACMYKDMCIYVCVCVIVGALEEKKSDIFVLSCNTPNWLEVF